MDDVVQQALVVSILALLSVVAYQQTSTWANANLASATNGMSDIAQSDVLGGIAIATSDALLSPESIVKVSFGAKMNVQITTVDQKAFLVVSTQNGGKSSPLQLPNFNCLTSSCTISYQQSSATGDTVEIHAVRQNSGISISLMPYP